MRVSLCFFLAWRTNTPPATALSQRAPLKMGIGKVTDATTNKALACAISPLERGGGVCFYSIRITCHAELISAPQKTFASYFPLPSLIYPVNLIWSRVLLSACKVAVPSA